MIENINLFFKDFSYKAVKDTIEFKILLDDKNVFINADVQRIKDYDVSGLCITKDIINIDVGDLIVISEEDEDIEYKVIEKERQDNKLTKLYLNPM